MRIENYSYLSSNKLTPIEYTVWLPDCEPLGVIQIVHGMSEHLGRYKKFAEFMVGKGYAVCANNHLGHGGSLINGVKGYFGEEGSYKTLIEDVKILTLIMRGRFEGKRIFLMGHSMGSFVVRLYITKYSHLIDGVILSGTSGPNFDAEYPAYLYAKAIKAAKGAEYISTKLDKMVVGSFSKRYSDPKLPNQWISSDTENVDSYSNDALCGFPLTVGGYCELFTMIRLVSNSKWAGLIKNQLPILIFSGAADPVGQYGAGVVTVRDRLLEAGQRDVWLNLYPGGRHEMLNERNAQEVMADVLSWVESHNPQ